MLPRPRPRNYVAATVATLAVIAWFCVGGADPCGGSASTPASAALVRDPRPQTLVGAPQRSAPGTGRAADSPEERRAIAAPAPPIGEPLTTKRGATGTRVRGELFPSQLLPADTTVSLVHGELPRSPSTHVTSDGRFEFANMPAGRWHVHLVLPGSIPTRIVIATIEIFTGQAVKDVRLDLADHLGGILEGIVTVDGVSVRAGRLRFVPVRSEKAVHVLEAWTQEFGSETRRLIAVINDTPFSDSWYTASLPAGDYRADLGLARGDAGNLVWHEALPAVRVRGMGTFTRADLRVKTVELDLEVFGPDGPLVEWRGRVVFPHRTDIPYSFRTDFRGRVRLTGLPAGGCRIQVVQGSGRLASDELTLPCSSTPELLRVRVSKPPGPAVTRD